ncbi:unnamed protein product [Rhizoctonia solani]|uniref:Uncharacterized protein n=1 Tax=Rhizoctonia solani TaxID=456999 RepID=A0A8H3C1R1_9AGAM|nr:unnamed protein product [Rhizoctonia solani]
MDSPLTAAELSRLRKAIQQRDRLVAQGSATSAVDLRISRALSNLKLYLPSQTHLAAVLKDWETSDSAKKSQIIIWLQQNILNDTPSQERAPPPATPPRPTFVHPPPPPPLLSRAASVVSRPDRPASISGTPPIPASVSVTPVPTPPNTGNAYPPREIHTQASLKPPTPPPKDIISGITHESLMRRHTLAGRPQHSRQSSGFVTSPTNDQHADSLARDSLYPRTFSGYNSSQPGVASPNRSNTTDSARRFGTQTSQPNSLGHDSNQYHTPPSSAQAAQAAGQFPSNFAQGSSSPQGPFPNGIQGGASPYIQQFIDAWKKIQEQKAQQNSMLMQQLNQAQQTPTSNTTAQIFAAAQQQQAQLQANLLQQLQAQQASSANDTTQLLANLQQQQQAQTNQMMSLLQQYQQNTPTFNPNQNFQQSQQMLDLLSQMQSGGAPGVDWASLASGSGMDPSMLMSMVMGGMDPTNIAMQGASFMFG